LILFVQVASPKLALQRFYLSESLRITRGFTGPVHKRV